ncbi:MAG: ATP-binding protein, partial [Candidatus Marinimicrobia bacterium]|nr:ATP-binding protein [Candidatus Neomarinimicrobiota bacterium]
MAQAKQKRAKAKRKKVASGARAKSAKPARKAKAKKKATTKKKAGAPRKKAAGKRATTPKKKTARRKKPAGKSLRPTSNADEMAEKQRDISVSEFFAKNRHLLGFDNPSKALLTTVKEGVDNALDACEEGGVVPDIRVEIQQENDSRFRVAIEDNGPGIVRSEVPKIFGRLLYGSKFHRLRQSRGQQGIGISAAGMYGLLTTGRPVKVTTRTGKRKDAHRIDLVIDTQTN